jgi:serine/threonine-protein kinase
MASGSGRLPPPFGDFGVVRLIASGGMGAVFEVRHRATGARYALKTILRPGDEKARARFRREAELLARCDHHPGIVKAHSLGETPDGQLYIVLDLVSGESLDALLARERRLPAARVAALGRVIAEALAHVHAQGIVHRDVKPSNILIDASGPHLTDFGLSTAEDVERLTRTGQFLGTAFYVSPEQAAHRAVGPAADIFSLGAVLYHALSGEVPLRADTHLAFFSKLASDDPVEDVRSVFPGAPPALAAVLARALAKDPERRYASALDLARDLERFERGGSTHASTEADAVRRRHAARRLGALALAAASVAVAGSLLWRSRGTRARLAAAESELALGEGAWREATPGPPGAKARSLALEHAGNALAAIGSEASPDVASTRERALVLVSEASSALATQEIESGEPARAVSTLRAGAALGPLPARARLVLARALLAAHDARAAADEAAASAAALPENRRAEVLELEGDAALESGDPARAQGAFSRALALRPGTIELLAKRGGAAALAGDAATAASDLAAVIPDASRLAKDREHNARLAPLAPALYARILAAKTPDPRDIEGAWRLAPPPVKWRADVGRAIVRWQHDDAAQIVSTLGAVFGMVRFSETDIARIALNLRAGAIARDLWPGAPPPWAMLAVIRLMFRELDPGKLEVLARALLREDPQLPSLHFLVATAKRFKGEREAQLHSLLDAIACFPDDVLGDDEEARIVAGEILQSIPPLLLDLRRPIDAAADLDPFLAFARHHESESVVGLCPSYDRVGLIPRSLECLDLGWTSVDHMVERNDAHAEIGQKVLEIAVMWRVHVLETKLRNDPEPLRAIARRALASRTVLGSEALASMATALASYDGCVEESKAFARDVGARDPAAGKLAAGELSVGRVLGLIASGKVAEARALVREPMPEANAEQRLAAEAAVLDAEHRWAEEAALLEGHASSLRLLFLLGPALAHLGEEARSRDIAAQAARFAPIDSWVTRFDAAHALDDLERTSGPRAALEAVARLRAQVDGPAPELAGFAARARLAVGDDAAAARAFEEIADDEAHPRLERFFPLAPRKTGFLRPRVLAGPEATFHLYGPAGGRFAVADVTGPVAVEPTSGTFPAVLTVRAKGATGSLAGFSFRAVPGSGEPAAATGTLFLGTWRGTIVPRPRDDAGEAWRTAPGDDFETTDLAFPWAEAAASAHVGYTDFALRAACELTVPAGTYSIEAFSDDGVRVFVDETLALEFWSEHAAAARDATIALAAGKHRVRVEYFQAGGPAYLRCRFGTP